VEEIDVSGYEEAHFFKALDLGAIGAMLQRRMEIFGRHLRRFCLPFTLSPCLSDYLVWEIVRH
jgi:hypothetical protein